MCRGALFFHGWWPRIGRGVFSRSYTRHASPLCIHSGRFTRTSARTRSCRRWRPRYTRYLHVRGCDFGNCTPRAVLNCKKQINLEIWERLETFTYRKFFDDYIWTISNWSLVLSSCTSLKCTERELAVQWCNCSDSNRFNSIKLSAINERKFNSHIAMCMLKKLHAESYDARI